MTADRRDAVQLARLRNRTDVRSRCACARGVAIPAIDRPWQVGSAQRRIHRQHVKKVIPRQKVLQFVDPFDADQLLPLGLDGER